MRVQELGDAQSALVLITDAQGERFQTAIEQKACVRIESAAEVIELVLDALDQGNTAGDRAGDDVGMTIQVFGTAMQSQVETVFERAEVDGRCKGVVNEGVQ